MRTPKPLLISFLLLLLCAPAADAQIGIIKESVQDLYELLRGIKRIEVKGKIVGVHDGDTATLLDANKTQYKIRFNGIDAPELGQPFGRRAKKNLSDLIFGKEVLFISDKVDKYGRNVGNVYINGIDANFEQVKAGMAWHFKRYADEQTNKDRKAYSKAEIKAREAKLGLWSEPATLQPPWVYRDFKRVAQEAAAKGRVYQKGPTGGCFYINSNGNKSYVKKDQCKL